MPHMSHRFIRLAAIGWCLILVACQSAAPTPPPTPSPARTEITLPITSLIAEPQRWSGQRIRLIAPVLVSDDERLITPLLVSDTQTLDDTQRAATIWLAQPLPQSVQDQLDSGAGLLQIGGTLSPPGAYGRDQAFSYQFTSDRAVLIEPERTTLANLAANPRALDRILLRVEGTLLIRQSSALLVDRVTSGGVPERDAREIKLQAQTIPPAIIAQFKQSGDVRWSSVDVIGWWQDGAFTPLSVTTRDNR